MRWLVAVVVVPFVALAGSGCGGDGDQAVEGAAQGMTTRSSSAPASESAPRTSDDEQAISGVHTRYIEAFLAGDGEAACALLTDEAAQQTIIDNAASSNPLPGDSCAELLASGAVVIRSFYGDDPEVRLAEIRVNGDRATAVATLADATPERQTFERVDGEWRIGPEPD